MKGKRDVVFDAEFDGLENVTTCWVCVCKDIETKEKFTFLDEDFKDGTFKNFAEGVRLWIGANVISYDANRFRELGILDIDHNHLVDLQVVSRTVFFNRPIYNTNSKKSQPHSVENFANKYGMVKPPIDVWNDPSKLDDYIHRCQEDVEIEFRMFEELSRFIFDKNWALALRIEHDMQLICDEMRTTGFPYAWADHKKYYTQIKEELESLEDAIINEVGYVFRGSHDYTLRRNRDGSISANTAKLLDRLGICKESVDFTSGYVFSVPDYSLFNPGSPIDRIDYLNKVGWEPYVKTKTHSRREREVNQAYRIGDVEEAKKLEASLPRLKTYGWEVGEDNLSTLPPNAPKAARKLTEWLTLNARMSRLEEWEKSYRSSSGRIHGTIRHIGAWTHRMAHNNPNCGNIFANFHSPKEPEDYTPVEAVKAKWDNKLRALWTVAKGNIMIGTDAEGIQLRVLAHIMQDAEYIKAVAHGDKSLKTDVHNVNLRALGLDHLTRDDAKTFIYAWVLGAALPKVSSILRCSASDAAAASQRFLYKVPALKRVKDEDVVRDAQRGFFVGLDGRKVMCDSAHKMLAGYLQNGEKIIMAHSNRLWRKWLKEEGIPYEQNNLVHDEFVTQTPISKFGGVLYDADGRPFTKEALRIGELQRLSIQKAGEELGMLCPLAGTTNIGFNWAEVH